MFLSVLVPVYNEEARVKKLLEINNFFKKQKFSFEIIVIDDGSIDKTLSILKQLQKDFEFKLITYPKNQGKGYALKQGVDSAQAEFILFTDIDLSTPLSEFLRLKPFLKNHDIVIATRKQNSSHLIKRQPLIREYLGKGFTWLSNLLLGLQISDFTCGFKCFSSMSGKKIFFNLTINRWGFDSEVLFLAHLYKFKVREVPVAWENDPQTKVKFPGDLIQSLNDLFRIRLNQILGKYS